MTIKSQGQKTQKQLKRLMPKPDYDRLIKGKAIKASQKKKAVKKKAKAKA